MVLTSRVVMAICASFTTWCRLKSSKSAVEAWWPDELPEHVNWFEDKKSPPVTSQVC